MAAVQNELTYERLLDFAQYLTAMSVPLGTILNAKEILEAVPILGEQLNDPTLSLAKRHNIVDKIFPQDIRDFMKLLCDNNAVDRLNDIFDIYERAAHKQQGDFHVILSYATPPTEEQLVGIKGFIKNKYGTTEDKLVFEQREDKSLVSGFKLTAGNDEYDWSALGRLKQLKDKLTGIASETSTQGIITLIRAVVEDFELEAKNQEIGTVSTVGDGIVMVEGIDHAAYGEIVVFDSGIKGMVQDIRADSIGCIVFGTGAEIKEGSRVMRTGKNAGVPVGDEIVGRMVDALGEPIDGLGPITAYDYRPIENKAPGVISRKEVNVPLQTGILAIDSMFPIGRGQRELIIGDRQTGKTTLAIDTIINQKEQDVICIYVAIGQKASTVAQIVSTLKRYDALKYTIIVAATASEPATMQYIAPYTGAAIGEYFMDKGKDVLIVYDDLSKHAQAYRAISLLLRHPPGREAYPGDVFYLHSRLLERACRRNEESGGGSMTALPIIETQAGDVSAYIPTNVISITDGQIYLETELFHTGQRPAVNVGLSVSRVGGKAQTKIMKTVSGTLRIDLAQYRELETFTQFSSDLDEATKSLLNYGKSLYQLLVQPQYHPMPLYKQVILLCAASNHQLTDIPHDKMEAFKQDLITFIESAYPAIISQIENNRQMTEELRGTIIDAVRVFKNRQ
jgi:F-type H+-transporting ATPase subunit alpha